MEPNSSNSKLNPEEYVKWSSDPNSNAVSFKLQSAEVVTIKSSNCFVTLTNQCLRINAKPGDSVTYTIPGKGSSSFRSLTVPVLFAKRGEIISPWFAPLKWKCILKYPELLKLQPPSPEWELTISFTNGGAIEFVNHLATSQEEASGKIAENHEYLPPYSE